MRKTEITAELVAKLIEAQFPKWAGLPITAVEEDGWDNNTFRLGGDMLVRLPSGERYVAAVEKEQRWLPYLSESLPVPIPQSLAMGAPGCGDLSTYDGETRAALAALDGETDVGAATQAWEVALTASWTGSPVWIHGDVHPTNLLVIEGRLNAVLWKSLIWLAREVGNPEVAQTARERVEDLIAEQ